MLIKCSIDIVITNIKMQEAKTDRIDREIDSSVQYLEASVT